MKLDSVYKIVDEGFAKSKIKGVDFVAYHGSHEPNMKPMKGRALFLTDSFELAEQFAKGEIYGDGLYDGETATVFTFKGHFNNPYYMTHEEYDEEGQDSNIDYKKWVKMGVDGIVLLPEDEWETTYYIVIDLSTIKLTDKKVFDDEAILDENIIHAKSSGDKLTNVVLKNPTRKELEENGIEKARCIEDSEGNWYFADMFDTLHFQIKNLLRNDVSFPYYDGNDSYGISYYDVEGNEFWYNSNELMSKNKCLEQYKKSDYLRKTFPNAYLRENPYGINSEDYENEDIDLDEAVIPEQVPEKLYHATFSKLLRKIKRCGYLGNSPYKLWSDSSNKYVYLATDPDEAYSYAETALDDCDNERLYDMLEDDDIVILEINTKYLDKNKLFRDENVVDGETTYQYEGIINCQIMKIYKPTLDESVFWKGERINNYEQHHYPWPEDNKGYDPEDEMIVWKNPSAEWMKYKIDSGEYFRFTYITTEDTLFVWYGDDAFHTDTMDIAGVDGDVVGTMGKGFIDYWPDDDDSPALGDRLFREKRAKFLDTIYPNGYETGVQY